MDNPFAFVPRLRDLIDTTGLPYSEFSHAQSAPWDLLAILDEFFDGFQFHNRGTVLHGAWVDSNVSLGEGSVVEPGAVIIGPAVIGKECRVRAGAYIRDAVVIGDNCVIGHCSEVKRSVLFTGVQVAHFNYVGNSILGNRSHLAAGAKVANVRLAGGTIKVTRAGQSCDTNLKKFGAILGDDAEVGCNAVLNPGSIIGRKSIVYPLVNWRGILDEGMIAKTPKECIVRE